MPYTNYPYGITSFGVPIIGGSAIPYTGKYFFVRPDVGNDGNDGLSADTALKTISAAYAKCTSGKNDVVYLIGNGTGTTANGADPWTTTFTWAKNATHLIGVTAPGLIGQRARITQSHATGMTVTGQACHFANFDIFHSNDTNGAILWTDTGQRNVYSRVNFQGIGGGTTAGGGANSRVLKVGSGGSGEHLFEDCVIGLDTVARNAANATLELTGATPRNIFKNCVFPVYATNAGALFIKTAAAGAIDRFTLFDNCSFINTGTSAMTVGISMAASAGGQIILKDSNFVNATDVADTAGLLQIWCSGAQTTSALTGLALRPTAS